MNPLVTIAVDGDVAIVTVDNPPVNALSPGVPEGLARAFDQAEADPAVRAIIVMGAGRTFVAGADITTLDQAAWGDLDAAPNLHALFARIEDTAKPVVFAIHGTALGGGLELAMSGHYRVAVKEAQVGQPEVNLGIIPGAEGTQRLPRLVGVQKALELCVTGKPIKSAEALDAGVLDAVIDGDLRTGALGFARTRAIAGGLRKTRDRQDRIPPADALPALLASARELAAKVRRHQTAPLRAIDAIEAAATLSFEAGCARERELFLECVQAEQAKALIHVFFAERAVAKVPDVTQDTPAAEIKTVAIVGAGTMGGGIAMACANAGLSVRLKDASASGLDTGLATIRRNYETSLTRGRFTRAQVDERLARIQGQLDDAGFADADLVIEAVFENLELKRGVFRALDGAAKAGAILGTNTSTLDIDRLAAETSRPAAVVGLHFFSPANVMRLLEIVRGKATSASTVATALAFAKRLGKVGVVVGNGPGFVGNRMMFPYMYETQFLVEEGATPEQVNRALTTFGMAMGMFAVDDMAGIDVAWRVRQELGHFTEAGVRKPLVANRLYEMGRLGQKTGKGWYLYDDRRKASPDAEVAALIRSLSDAAGIQARPISDQEIVEQSVYALVNEGAKVLEEGLAVRASDIDVIYVNGYGFPAWRGGPLFYADRVGLATVLDSIRAFHAGHGARWTPAPLLERLVKDGRTFRDLDRSRRG